MYKDNKDVISLPIELNSSTIDGKYRFVIAAIQKAKEFAQGKIPSVISKSTKITTVAIEEILFGPVRVLTGEAAVNAADSEKLVQAPFMDEAVQKESMPESKLEIEKEVEDFLRIKEKTGTENI